MNIEDEVNQFRRDLKSYNYHKAKIKEINEELLELAHKMKGVSSIRYDKLHSNNTRVYHDRKVEYIVLEEQLIQERKIHEILIKKVDDCLEQLPDDEKELLIDIYIKGTSYDQTALKRHVSKDKVKLDLKKSIKKCLKS